MSLKAILWALHDAPVDDPQATLILVSLAENAHDSGRAAWPAVSTIARKARCSERTVHRRLRELEADGLIRKGDQRLVGHLDPRYRPVVYDLATHRVRGDSVSPLDEFRGDSRARSGVTPVADEPSLEPSTPRSPPEGGDRAGAVDGESGLFDVDSVGVACHNGNMSMTAATPARRRQVADDDPQWSAFWSAYPRKLSKAKARKAWAKALDAGADPDVLVRAAQRFARRDVEVRFIPYPATWLNGERWLDEEPERRTVGRGMPKAGSPEECPDHRGEWASNCRIHAADRIARE